MNVGGSTVLIEPMSFSSHCIFWKVSKETKVADLWRTKVKVAGYFKSRLITGCA